jgi:hypothetical protein
VAHLDGTPGHVLDHLDEFDVIDAGQSIGAAVDLDGLVTGPH